MRLATLYLSVLLVCNLTAWGQESPESLPRPDAGLGAGAEEADEDLSGSPWHDTVHWLGIAGGLVALLALCGGGALYIFVARRNIQWSDSPRPTWRYLHVTAGAAAVVLALVHHFGRWAQEGGPEFGLEPPHLAGVGFLFLAVTGALRLAPPKAWRRRWRVFAYGHRAAFALALAMLILHALHESRRFG